MSEGPGERDNWQSQNRKGVCGGFGGSLEDDNEWGPCLGVIYSLMDRVLVLVLVLVCERICDQTVTVGSERFAVLR